MSTVAVTMTVGATCHYWMAPVANESAGGLGVTAPNIVRGYLFPDANGNPAAMSVQLDPAYLWEVRLAFRNAPPIRFDGFVPGSGGDLITLLTAQGWTPAAGA